MVFVSRATRGRAAALALGVVGWCAQGQPTAAEPEESTVPAADSDYGPLHLEVQGGPGNPLGAFGVALAVDAADWLSFEVGGGAGRSALQYGAMARVRRAISHFGASVGIGLSRGDFRADHRDNKGNGNYIDWDNAMWINTELGADFDLRDKARFRVFGGLGFMTDSDGCAVTETKDSGKIVSKFDCNSTSHVLPYIGIGLRI